MEAKHAVLQDERLLIVAFNANTDTDIACDVEHQEKATGATFFKRRKEA